jgi:hypothetical protein
MVRELVTYNLTENMSLGTADSALGPQLLTWPPSCWLLALVAALEWSLKKSVSTEFSL